MEQGLLLAWLDAVLYAEPPPAEFMPMDEQWLEASGFTVRAEGVLRLTPKGLLTLRELRESRDNSAR